MFEFRSKKELERWKVVDFYPDPTERKSLEEKLASKGFLINEEVKLRKKDGTVFCASISSTSAKDESGKIIHYDGIIEDITERKKAQETQKLHQANLETLSNELTMAQEEAKRDLAVALHDKLGQSLALAKFKSSELNKQSTNSKHKKILDEIVSYLDEAINESRDITYELSPPVLYEMGLIPAIEWKLDDMENKNGIKTSLIDHSNSHELSQKEQIITYRTIGELLQNIKKHSNAKNVNVSFGQANGTYKITVSDNGIGFDLETVMGKAISQKKFGLFSIMERIKYIGGEMNINTTPNIGTDVIINLPINN
jgi:signal transduction histidine kinase